MWAGIQLPDLSALSSLGWVGEAQEGRQRGHSGQVHRGPLPPRESTKLFFKIGRYGEDSLDKFPTNSPNLFLHTIPRPTRQCNAAF